MQPAPLFADIAEGPEGGAAFWLTAEDGVRIRIGVWPHAGARGTVLMLPGRTEYVEKYGRTAAELARRGYATVSVDWRGQGLADRALADRAMGHVGDFAEYQADMRAVATAAQALDLPRPWHLIGHSMGGAIGLRALLDGLDARSAAFTAPMWRLSIAPWMRPFAGPVTRAAHRAGRGRRYAPGTGPQTYVLAQPFEGNFLTRDAEMYAHMRHQLERHPELELGGPSLTWVSAALAETRALRRATLPDLPAYCGLGTAEKIVEAGAIRRMMARWPGGTLELYEGAEHEILMEGPALRGRFLDAAAALFRSAEARSAAGA